MDQGWTITEQNYRTPFGECDLIVSRDGLTAFVEVKTRKTDQFGPPEAALTREKQKHIKRVAQHYISERDDTNRFRFDVLAIEFDPQEPDVRHIEGAFHAEP